MEGWIDHTTPVLMIGSCFTDNIGALLARDGFCVMANPFGPIYNPAAISRVLDKIIGGKPFEMEDCFEHGGLWSTYFSHTLMSRATADECLALHNHVSHEAHAFCEKAKVAIITLGTTRAFALNKKPDFVVTNCHKMPSDTFVERLLTVEETSNDLDRIVTSLLTYDSALKIIFTISPIRHPGPGGAIANNLSKSTLRLAVERCLRSSGFNVAYFPAFEIMMDDLRDYRFYAPDMTHPSAQAVDYIYEKFADSFFTPSTRELARQCRRLSNRVDHRRLTAATAAHEAFERETRRLIKDLRSTHPEINSSFLRKYS